jgi:hypothetical protein
MLQQTGGKCPGHQAPDIQQFNKIAEICKNQPRRQIISFQGQY